MTSYNLLNGVHTSEREDLLKGFLREELGWKGLIMTDWVIALISNAKGSKYRGGWAAPSVKAGNDVFMPGSKGDYKQTLDALEGKNPDCELTRDEVKYCAARVVDTAWKLCGK
jgi:beta-glucosidase